MRVTLAHDLEEVAEEWDALHARDPLATPFLSLEWLRVWVRHWSEGGRAWVLVARDGERPVALLPLQLGLRRGLRFLTGLGVGFGDHWDVIAAPKDRAAALPAIAAELAARAGEWDALVIDKLPEHSPTLAALRDAGLRVGPAERLPSPRIELPDSFDTYLASLSKNRRYQIRRNLKALEDGRLSVREVVDPAELPAVLARWQALRAQWWEKRERAMTAEHGSERFLAFTEQAVLALLPLGRALVWEVSQGDRPIGVTVNFLDDRAFYYWLWGFDAGVEELRPGHALIAHGIRWSIETGRRYFDFMLGGENYKYDYAPEPLQVSAMTVGSPRLRSRATVGLVGLRRAARALPARAPSRVKDS